MATTNKRIKKLILSLLIFILGFGLAACTTPANMSKLPTSAPSQTAPLFSMDETYTIGDTTYVTHSIPIELSALAIADFDQDGHLDLVSAGEPQLTIFQGDGQGGLTTYSHAAAGENPVDFAIADFDEDGSLDIVIANHDTDYLTLLLGTGSGTFYPAPNSPLIIKVSPHPHAVEAVDINTDGHTDLVVDHRDAGGLLILPGLGDGRFQSPGTLIEVNGDPYRGMAVGDLNKDGFPDLVILNPAEVGIFLNSSSKNFSFESLQPVPAAAPFGVGLGDFNADGNPDLIAASDEGSSRIDLYLGHGDGTFSPSPESPFELAPGGKNIVVADFNGDEFSDAAVCSYPSTDILIIIGGKEQIQTQFLPAIEHPWGLAAGDLNEDGWDDLVIADDTAQIALIYLSLAPQK